MPPRRRADPAPRARTGLGATLARHRVATTVVVVLAVLVAGLAVALPVVDSAVRQRVADRIAVRAQGELGLRSPPLVTIGGSWFLWQAVRGRYDGATVSSAVLPYDGNELGATRVRLTGVRVPPAVLFGRSGTVTASGGDVRTVVPWALLGKEASARAGTGVTFTPGDAPGTVAAASDVAGVPLAVTVEPRVAGDSLVLRTTGVTIAGRDLGVDGARALADRFGLGRRADALLDSFSYPLDQVPEQVSVRSVGVRPDGLLVGGALKPLRVPVGG